MLDDSKEIVRPSLKLNLRDMTSQPMSEPFIFGGAPRLPAHMDWPCWGNTPLHFFGQIDLSALPDSVQTESGSFGLPDLPKRGTLFVFLRLDADCLNTSDAVILYAKKDTRDCPEREIPEEIGPLDQEAIYVEPGSIQECGTMLRRQYGDAHGFLSHQLWNPYLDRFGPKLDRQDRHEADMTYADQLRPYGINFPVTPPFGMKDESPEFMAEIETHLPLMVKRNFSWTWEAIFEVSRNVLAECYNFPIYELLDEKMRGNCNKSMQKYLDKMIAKKDGILADSFDGSSGFWQRRRFGSGRLPIVSHMFDDQFEDWMGYARLHRDKPLTNEIKFAFLELLKTVAAGKGSDQSAELMVLERWADHPIVLDEISAALLSAIELASDVLQTVQADADRIADDMVDANDGEKPIQMFGFGRAVNNVSEEHKDDVLLMQIERAGGVSVPDGALQVWINRDNLAAGRFDRTVTTFETS